MPNESMPQTDALLTQARSKLATPEPAESPWPAVTAAAFFAASALAFATASVLAPPLAVTPAAKTGVR
jgi:hypothetical protein